MEETKTLKDVTVNVKQGASSFYLKEGTEPIKVIRHKAITADGRLIPEEIDETNIKKHVQTTPKTNFPKLLLLNLIGIFNYTTPHLSDFTLLLNIFFFYLNYS